MGLMNNDIFCDECEKYLFMSRTCSLGASGAEAQQLGFVYKNACLFSDTYSSLFFCSHTCAKAFYARNIPGDPKMTAAIEEMKADIPKMTKEICEGLARIQKAFKDRK